MLGEEGDAEIATIMGRVYKVRPFGLPASNMRNLNPSGEYSHSNEMHESMTPSLRYR